jgi:hypothetical protein
MGTRSTIAVKHLDGSVSQIYCHWDGCLEHNGKILTEHYATQELAEALVALGDMSSLDKSIECPEGHTFDTSIRGYSVFYGRDRGEEDCEACRFADGAEFIRNRQSQQYDYIFADGSWYHIRGRNLTRLSGSQAGVIEAQKLLA